MFGLSTDDRREARKAAMRHYGRKYAWWWVFGPTVGKAVLLAAVLGVAWVTWARVPHAVLAGCAFTVAGVALVALTWPHRHALVLRRRMVRAAVATSAPRVQLGWAYGVLLFAGLGMGWLSLWSPFS